MCLTSCSMVSFGSSVFSSPLSFTASRFCQRLSEWVLFLSCSCNAGAAVTPDPAVGSPSLCRRCSISCCFEVSRYSWYKTSGHKHIIAQNDDSEGQYVHTFRSFIIQYGSMSLLWIDWVQCKFVWNFCLLTYKAQLVMWSKPKPLQGYLPGKPFTM